MYWPSTPADGEFFFQEKDEILMTHTRYADWRYCAMWPTSKLDIAAVFMMREGYWCCKKH